MIVPFRSHIRQAWWAVAEDGFKERSAVMLGVDYAGSAMSLGRGVLGMAAEMSPEMEGEAICIEDGGVERKSLGNGRFVGRMVDWEMVKMALEGRINGHGRECLVEKEEQIKYARMIDVEERKVVPCAVGCEYFALSYVWGGVMPEEGALRKGTLPRTIEDAIETTRKMGRRYLWVDALCIDQRPNPTPEQRAEKERQLRIMDMIYSSATLTLVAVAGKDSKAGLPGVNSARPRTIQVRETIGGRTFFTVPPTSTQERNSSLWSTRAWTLQEELLSRRYLFFSDTHVEFIYGSSRVPESLDTKTLSDWGSLVPDSLNQLFLRRDEKTLSDVDDGDRGLSMNLFWGIIINYTSRRMTNDGDSLNAILGLLSVWERMALSSPCVWGLPLADMPQMLGWMHHRSVSPRRRPSFPSWAWAGWDGEVTMNDMRRLGGDGGNRFHSLARDMTVRYVGIDDNELIVEGWQVTLEIRTEPFSDVLMTGTEEVMGNALERNFLHPNTLASGRYECLVIERLEYQIFEGGSLYQRVFLMVLDKSSLIAQRRTLITLTTLPGRDFMCLGPAKRVLRLV